MDIPKKSDIEQDLTQSTARYESEAAVFAEGLRVYESQLAEHQLRVLVEKRAVKIGNGSFDLLTMIFGTAGEGKYLVVDALAGPNLQRPEMRRFETFADAERAFRARLPEALRDMHSRSGELRALGRV